MNSIVEDLIHYPPQFPGTGVIRSDGFSLMGCRSFEQFCSTLRSLIDPARFCPFCQGELSRRNRTALHSTKQWLLLTNEYPHKATSRMFLVVPQRHCTHPAGLRPEDWSEAGELFEWCIRENHIEGGGLFLRFGAPHLHAGTVSHLHFNIIEPISGTEYRPPLAKNADEHASDYLRLLGFRALLDERGGVSWLLSDHGIEETQPKIP